MSEKTPLTFSTENVVRFAFDPDGTNKSEMSKLPALVMKWSGLTFFAGDDGFVWMCDEGQPTRQLTYSADNAAFFLTAEFDGIIPDDWNAAMEYIAVALTAMSNVPENIDF